MAKIEFGETVIAVLREPREKVWGIVHQIDQSGIYIKGIDLNGFEDMVRAIMNHEPFYGLNEQFLPMWRIERITKDEADGEIPSLQAQFERRTGMMLGEL